MHMLKWTVDYDAVSPLRLSKLTSTIFHDFKQTLPPFLLQTAHSTQIPLPLRQYEGLRLRVELSHTRTREACSQVLLTL